MSDIMVSPDMQISLLSVPTLSSRKIETVFIPEDAFFFDLENEMKVLDQDLKEADGLLYIKEQQE